MSMNDNIILITDGYKPTHWVQYPPKTEFVYSYLEARLGGKFPATVQFGPQYIIGEYLAGQVVTAEKIKQAKRRFAGYFGSDKLFNEAGWQHILKDHGGRIPVSIRAIREGTIVPEGNALMTVVNTCKQCYWVTNYVETLLVQAWYTITVATLSYMMKNLIREFLIKTQGNDAGLEWKLHDFGCRGVSSMESAAIGGAAHLINFKGTDTLTAIDLIEEFYGLSNDKGEIAMSIPAAEHSTITSWGGPDQEIDAFMNMLTQFPTGLVAVVSDSYDIEKACKTWGTDLLDAVLARNGTLVVRPDSGDPTVVVPRILEILGQGFGFTYTTTGHKMLNDKVRVIQGDGINYESTRKILEAVASKGWSTGNLAFGMGGALLQQLNRDTQRFAFKCSAAMVGGKWRDVYKQPKSDPAKNSKRGRLMVIQTNKGIETIRENDNEFPDLLVEVFRDGNMLFQSDFDEVRARADGKSIVLA